MVPRAGADCAGITETGNSFWSCSAIGRSCCAEGGLTNVGVARSAAITIAGQVVTITQSGTVVGQKR